MRRKFKKILLSLACSLICTSVISLSAVNVTTELTITTDKDEYSSGEEIKVDVSLKNGTNSDIKDISINSEIPEDLKLKDGSIDYSTDLLSKGDSLSFSYTLTDSADTEVVDPDDGQDDETNKGDNSSEEITNVDGTDKTKSINTGDNDYSYMILIFILSFIIIMGLTNKKIRKRFFIVILIGGLVTSNFVNVSATDDNTNNKELSSSAIIFVNDKECVIDVTCTYSVKESDDFIPSEDAYMYSNDDFYSDKSNEDNLDSNIETGEVYYNNELIVFVNDNLNSVIDDVMKRYPDSIIAGKNIYVKSFMIRFPETFDYNDLSKLKSNITNLSNDIDKVYLNYFLNYDSSAYPNDTDWVDEWEDIPSGINWNMEAINAPTAWEYYDMMSNVNVGIYDSGFGNNNDLDNVLTYTNNGDEIKNNIDHGTHVAGIIGAQYDNEYGICGVFSKASMIGYSTNFANSINMEHFMLTRLICEQGCKVVNMSLGNDLLGYAATRGNKNAQNDLIRMAESYTTIFTNMNTDSVIVISAGNNSYSSHKYVSNENALYGYYKVKSNSFGNLTCEDHEGNEIHNIKGTVETNFVDAKWNNYINLVDDSELKTKIIVVGAADRGDNSSYKLSPFNNGDRVDVYAPGVNIYSTVSESSGNFTYKDGTSMAAPHVTGLAAMCYSINKNLTSAEVKDLIVRNADNEISGTDKKMINAGKTIIDLINDKLYGKICGTVIDEAGINMQDVSIQIINSNDIIIQNILTDKNGYFEYDLEDGNYDVVLSKEGYQTKTISYEVHANETTEIGNIVLETLKFAGGDGSEENPYQVSTPEQLNAVRENLNAHYIQTADIDLSIYENWEPIGYGVLGFSYMPGISGDLDVEIDTFNGSYDGNNHKITNMNIIYSDKYTIGLFGMCSANSVLKNIKMEGLNIKLDKSNFDYNNSWDTYKIYYNSNIGSVAGVSEGQIDNCRSSGNITLKGFSDGNYGGLFGIVSNASNCVNDVELTVSNTRSYSESNKGASVKCGGITAATNTTGGNIFKCINNANIYADGLSVMIGGIIGQYGKLDYCINYGDITGFSYNAGINGGCYVGGIGGDVDYSINNSINYGNIYGSASGTTAAYIGGIAGRNGSSFRGKFNNCYNLSERIDGYGEIKQNDEYIKVYDYCGRLFGYCYLDNTKECYSLDSTLVNDFIVESNIGESLINGASLSETEINEKIQYILDELNM